MHKRIGVNHIIVGEGGVAAGDRVDCRGLKIQRQEDIGRNGIDDVVGHHSQKPGPRRLHAIDQITALLVNQPIADSIQAELCLTARDGLFSCKTEGKAVDQGNV